MKKVIFCLLLCIFLIGCGGGNPKFEGNINLTNVERKVLIDIDTNAPDGAILDILIGGKDFKFLSEKISVKDKKAIKEIEIPEDWGNGYIAVLTTLTFINSDIVQPENVIKLYGEKGEKLEGKLVKDGKDGSKYAVLEKQSIAIPNLDTVRAELKVLYDEGIKNFIKDSKGFVKDVKHIKDNDFVLIEIVIDDLWYQFRDYEKERIANSFCKSVKELAIASEIAEKNSIMVNLVDKFGKELTTLNWDGTYGIKK